VAKPGRGIGRHIISGTTPPTEDAHTIPCDDGPHAAASAWLATAAPTPGGDPGRCKVLIALLACLAGTPSGTATAPARLPPPPPHHLLGTAARLSPAEATKVEQGEVVVRVLDATAAHEVAVSGAVRIAVPKETFLALASDPARFKRGPAILQLGVFAAPPSPRDLGGLTLDETELAALRRCARGDCSSKLAALDPDAFRAFDWPAPGAKPRAETLVRAGLAVHVRDYLARGNAAMMRFDRTRVPTSLAAEFEGVLAASAPVTEVAPDLTAFLARYWAQPPPPVTSEACYWARETFGLKPVLSAYHVLVHRPPGRPDLGLVVSKQFYASRYFDVSLETTIAADDPSLGGAPGCYLVYVARSRVDSLRGRMGGLKRGAVEREARDATRARLAGLRAQLAAASAAPPRPGPRRQ
jgi:hypothetical protein